MNSELVNKHGGLREDLSPFIKEFKHALYIIKRSPLTLLGFILFLIFITIAIVAPIIAPYDPFEMRLSEAFQPPSWKHPFGTDEMGRDILSRVLWGSRISLRVGVTVVLTALCIGTILGGIAGYVGGVVDEVIMRITDLVLAFPSMILALALAAALGPGLNNAMIAISVTWWPWYARLVRGQVLSIREAGFVEASRCVGASGFRILFRHILPNAFGPVIVNASMDFGWTILTAAALGFLGIGAQPPQPEWGLMISVGRIYFMDKPWIATFPGLAIFLVVLASNLIGDGLGEILNPRLRRR
ncbi:D,D-dipeptide ABC transporter permease [Candidatus Bathyarchaeota archaeon]|nr:MAG: ABC transporter permease [Candidatus Bathyarchaeota archaeon]RLI31465.1 MAG: D,D-dipeptide ABC transporter permease [Candidatus Bathyarchaeota archaeon]